MFVLSASPASAKLPTAADATVQPINCVVQSVVDGKAILICDARPAQARQTRPNPTTGLTVAPDYDRVSPKSGKENQIERARPLTDAPSSSPFVLPKSSRSSSEWIATGPDHIA